MTRTFFRDSTYDHEIQAGRRRPPSRAGNTLGLRLALALTFLASLALTASSARACDWCHRGKRVYVVAAEPARVATVVEEEPEVRTVVVRRVRRVAVPVREQEPRGATPSPQARATQPSKQLPRAAAPAKDLPRAALPDKELPKPVPPAKDQPRAAAPSKQAPRAAAPSKQAPRAAAQAPSRDSDVVEEEYVEEEVPTRVARLVPAERVVILRGVKKHHARGTVYVLADD